MVDVNAMKSLIDWRKIGVNECGRFKEGNDGSQIIWNNLNFHSQQHQTDQNPRHVFLSVKISKLIGGVNDEMAEI